MRLRGVFLFFTFFLLALTGHLFGQAKKYAFQQLKESDGLTQNFVYGIVQDDRGFLWAGTGEGLMRYDGFEIKTFTKADSLGADFVTTAFRTSSGNLVFGHNQGGVSFFDGLVFKQLVADTINSKVVSITEDKSQNIWVATQSKGLLCIDRATAQASAVFPTALREQIINTIYVNGDFLSVGTQEGLLFFHIKEKSLDPLSIDLLPPYTEVVSILHVPDAPAMSWVGTASNGILLLKYDATTLKVTVQQRIRILELARDVVQAIDHDPDGDLWVGTRDHGVLHVNLGRDGQSVYKTSFFNKASGYPFTSVNSLVVDRQGQVWVGTMGDGLIRIYKEFFRYFPLNDKYQVTDVRAITETPSGYLLATDRGLFRIAYHVDSDEYSIQPEAVLGNEPILSVFTDSRKNTWVGTENKGIFLFTQGSDRINALPLGERTQPVEARLFEEDLKGNLWISARTDGVYVIDPEKQVINHLTTSRRFIHNDVFAIKADTKGNIWFGTYGAGLARLDKSGALQLFSKDETIRTRDINDIDEDNMGNVWIATEGDGFFKYADQSFTQIGSDASLPSPFVKGIKFDPQGRIWYSFRKGLGYYDLKSEKKRLFTKADGILPDESYSSHILIDSKLNKWFSNDYGVTLFENDTIRTGSRQLDTYLTGIRIFFKEYPMHTDQRGSLNASMVAKLPPLKLSHEENHLTFDFAAIDLNRVGKIYYRHLLQEYDTEWSPPSLVNSITYTNLDPGEYVLKLQATDDIGSWVDPVTEYAFVITPPYWRRPWFYLLQIVSVLTLFILTYFMGTKALATKRYVLRLMLFSSFFITLEYVENFVDPLASGFFGGAPIFRFFLNFILALLLLPVESIITHWMMNREIDHHRTSVAPAPDATSTHEEAYDAVAFNAADLSKPEEPEQENRPQE